MAAALASMDGVGLQTYGVTYAAVVALYVGRKNLSVAKVSMIDESMPQAAVASMETGFLVMYAFGQLFLGSLAQAAGPRRGLMVCYALAALTLACFGTIESELARIVLWSSNGLLQAMCYPLCMEAVRPHLPSETRGQLTGLWTTSLAIGGVMGNVVAAWATTNFGWRAAFFPGPAGLLAAVAMLIAMFLSDNRQAKCSTGSQLQSPTSSINAYRSTHDQPTKACSSASKSAAGPWEVLSSTPGLLPLGCSYFMVKLVRYAMLFWMPLYLHQYLGFSSATAATVATLFDVGAFFGSVISGFIADNVRHSENVVLGMCLASALLCSLLAYVPNNVVVLLAGVAIAGPDALLTGLCTQQCVERANRPECLTTALSVVNGLGSLGAMLQGYLVTCVLEHSHFGWPGVWAGCTLVSLLASALVALARLQVRDPPFPLRISGITTVTSFATAKEILEWLSRPIVLVQKFNSSFGLISVQKSRCA